MQAMKGMGACCYSHCCLYTAGREGRRYTPEELAAVGLMEFAGSTRNENNGTRAVEHKSSSTPETTAKPLVSVGPGLPAISRRIWERIRANEFVDFMELPPARGKAKPLSQDLDGHILVVQAADLAHTRKVIPDLSTWLQCFALYTAVILKLQPERAVELMAYQSIIAKASVRYKWPSWVMYDASFRQEVAGVSGTSWAKVDPSIYSLCFTGQTLNTENWCQNCQTLDHTPNTCPLRPRKRPWGPATGQAVQPGIKTREVCHRYNRYAGDCKFGRECRYRHICSSCGDPHPASRCKQSRGEKFTGNSQQ